MLSLGRDETLKLYGIIMFSSKEYEIVYACADVLEIDMLVVLEYILSMISA